MKTKTIAIQESARGEKVILPTFGGAAISGRLKNEFQIIEGEIKDEPP